MQQCKYCTSPLLATENILSVRKMDSGHLYLLKDQTLPGRCIFASARHIKHLTDLSLNEYTSFFRDLFRIIHALKKIYAPDQINCLMMGDLAEHLHVHIVPKYKSCPDWGKMFEIDRQESMLLTDLQYAEQVARINAGLAECNRIYHL